MTIPERGLIKVGQNRTKRFSLILLAALPIAIVHIRDGVVASDERKKK